MTTPSDGSQRNVHPGGATTSLWHGTVDLPRYPRLTQNRTADVCIVGAGIAGLSVAYHLAREGKKVVVLDDGPIGGGETGRTTAHLTNAMDDRVFWLEQVHGPDGARLAVSSHAAAIDRIEEIVQREGIDCDFVRLDGFLMPRQPDDTKELEREAEAVRRAGQTDAALVPRAPIAGFESGTALRFPRQAQFHALRYLAGLARAVVEKYQGEIFCDTHVEGIDGGEPCTVTIDGGTTVTAAVVVVCTNASISDYVQTHIKSEAKRTYAIAAVVPRGSVEQALFWDTGEAYHYVRTAPLASGGAVGGQGGQPAAATSTDGEQDALIVGGEDHRVGRGDDDSDVRWKALEDWMRQRWPRTGKVIYRWSGQVVEPSDGLAFIGRNPDGATNVYLAMGDSGQGMTHGTIAGMLLAELVQGREHPWASLYDPARLSLRVQPLGEMAKHNVDVAVQMAKGYLTPDIADVNDIPPGEGRVVRRGAQKVAVYRDDSGHLHEKSAVCTHLKCIVAWNGTEKSWDCPCHGSRFAPTGEVLNGPAITPLADVSAGPDEHGEGPR